MTDHPQEHESLDTFVAKVEASGEDKRHEPLGYVDGYAEEWGANGWNPASSITISPTATHHVAIYTQAQRDAYAAEAVKQEQQRLVDLVDEFIAVVSQQESHLALPPTIQAIRLSVMRNVKKVLMLPKDLP